jgi:hypothetical protein
LVRFTKSVSCGSLPVSPFTLTVTLWLVVEGGNVSVPDAKR